MDRIQERAATQQWRMSPPLVALLAVLALGLVSANRARAEDIAMETRSVDARVLKVNLDGQIDLKLKQGPTASLTVFAEKRLLSKIITVQAGDSLRIDSDVSGYHISKPQLRAELTLPSLSELRTDGVGAVEMSGFSGEELRLTLSGTGKVSVTSQYKKVNARSTGVGSLTLNAGDSDVVELSLPGVGSMSVAGRSNSLVAKLSGVGSLDAHKLAAQTVSVELDGVGSAKVFAQQSASASVGGVGSVTVYGKPPTRNAKTSGIGKIIWD